MRAVHVPVFGDINGDLVLAGNMINVRGDVAGDVFTVGQNVTISGDVAGSVFAIGQDVTISGDVLGSVRAAGPNVKLLGKVGKNFSAAGAFITVDETAHIGWGAQIGGAIITIGSDIEHNLFASGAEITLKKKIGGYANIFIDEGGTLTLQPDAKIGKDLKYRGDQEPIINDGAEIMGETIRQEMPVKRGLAIGKIIGIGSLIGLIGSLIVGLILASIFKGYTMDVVNNLTKKVGQSFGWGAIILLAGPAAILICMITIIGIPLGLILLAVYIISIYITTVFAGITLGFLILKAFKKEKSFKELSYIGALVLGIIVYYIITKIPLFGWLISLAGVLWALGGMTLACKSCFETKKETKKSV